MNYLNLSLKNFEEMIDTRILERGFEIYKNDQILSVEQIDKDYWEAVVQGSEDYELKIQLIENHIEDSDCNCPYDMGPYCKHEVAIFNFLKYSNWSQHSGQNKMERIKSIIKDLSPDEIQNSLLKTLKHHKNAREDFLEKYSTST